MRLVCGTGDGIFFSPYTDNDEAAGILLRIGETLDLYLSRDPALIGQAWYVRTRASVPDTYWAECWENTPVGT
jgi:hypothetical protein